MGIKYDKGSEVGMSMYDVSGKYFNEENEQTSEKKDDKNEKNEKNETEEKIDTNDGLLPQLLIEDVLEDGIGLGQNELILPIPIGSEIDCLAFVVSLSSYVEVAENRLKFSNRLLESLDLFEKLLNNEIIQQLEIFNVCLILTCCDEFKYLLDIIPFASQFSDFKEKNDNVSVIKYIITQFETIYVKSFVIPNIRASLKLEQKGNAGKKKVNTTKKLKYFLVSGWNTNGVGRIWNYLKSIAFDSYKPQNVDSD